MIRLWDSGLAAEGGDEASSSQISLHGEESPLPQPTAGNDLDAIVCEGSLLTALLNKMETLLDQVSV